MVEFISSVMRTVLNDKKVRGKTITALPISDREQLYALFEGLLGKVRCVCFRVRALLRALLTVSPCFALFSLLAGRKRQKDG
jgi:hypothetical protein